MALSEQSGIKRECGERRISTQESGREKQAKVLGSVSFEGEISSNETHKKGSAEVLKKCVEWKCSAKPTGEGSIGTMPSGSAEAATEEDNQKCALRRTDYPAARGTGAARACHCQRTR